MTRAGCSRTAGRSRGRNTSFYDGALTWARAIAVVLVGSAVIGCSESEPRAPRSYKYLK